MSILANPPLSNLFLCVEVHVNPYVGMTLVRVTDVPRKLVPEKYADLLST